MATGKEREVLGRLHVLFSVGTYRNLTDGQLLERFATDRGEAGELALAALIERHGPMVLRVCRGVLADPHDVEDAFQATFLVLVRKARGLWVRESLGPWLHQVAYRTARSARSAAARRRRHDRLAAAALPEGQVMRDDELVRIVHEEIERLPERYRAPVVLCDLEGRTNEQAARHLGWPVGTIKSRLSRGRLRLRDRLTRRGLAPGAGVLFPPAIGDGLVTRVPAALANATVRAASQFTTPATVLAGPAALLAQGVLRAMILTRWLTAASLLLVLGAAVPGAVLLTQRAPGDEPEGGAAAAPVRRDDPPGVEVKPGPLRVELRERGTLEPTRNVEVVNEVEGQSTIVSIQPEGTRVKTGDLVLELDSAILRDRLANQEIAIKRAEAEREAARNEREAAEGELRAFEQVVFPLREEAISDRLAVAEAEVALGQRRVERLGRGADADDLAVAEARLAVMLAEGALRQAQGELRLLREFTKGNELRRLETRTARTASLLIERESAFKLEVAKAEKLRRQIERCQIHAPADGILVYAGVPVVAGLQTVEEGATVRERQSLFRIFNPSEPMRVNAKVPEAVVDQLRPGMRARVRVDALPDRDLSGTVRVVAPRPDALSWPNPPVKLYTTLVELDEADPKLRPGMTAAVEVRVADLDDVLTVPVPAVRRDGKAWRVAVRKDDGGFAWREVTLGRSDGKVVEIKEGLAAGERVAPDAAAVRSKDEQGRKPPGGS